MTDGEFREALKGGAVSVGKKMKDAELIGIPINLIIGKQYTENNEIELRHRDGKSSISMVEDIETIFDHYKSK